LKAITHKETYKDYTDKDIEELYSQKESRSDSELFIRENNKETLAQVFTDVRYTRKDNVHFSETLLQVLEEQGFMNQ